MDELVLASANVSLRCLIISDQEARDSTHRRERIYEGMRMAGVPAG
jgi:hypothetical protein